MALYSSRNICLCPLRGLAFKIVQPYLYSSSNQPINDDNGELDNFTSNLMQRKSRKWANRKALAEKRVMREVFKDLTHNNVTNNIENLDTNAINDLFQMAVDYDDTSSILGLTEQCIAHNRIPSLAVLLSALSVCSRNGQKTTIIEVCRLCEKVRPEILHENSNFEHYMAEAIWVKGDIFKSLEIFGRIYKENVYLRRKITHIMKHLIVDSVSNRSEAVMVKLVQFAEMLVTEYKDYYTLSNIWHTCILSDWFTDQQLALALLQKYPMLGQRISGKLPLVVRISLARHRTEIVYQLTEGLLKLELESEIGQVLLALMDYWIKQGDFRQCREIILWSLQNNIRIPTIASNKKLLTLLGKDNEDVASKMKDPLKKRTYPWEYKF